MFFSVVLMVMACFLLNANAGVGASSNWRATNPINWGAVNITGGTAVLSNATVTSFTATTLTATTATTTTLHAPRFVAVQVEGRTTAATVGTEKVSFVIPADLVGYALADANARVYTAGVTGTLGLSVKKRSTAGAEATAYTLAVTTGVVDSSEGSGTLANRTFAAGDLLHIDATSVHSGTVSYGLWLSMKFIKP